MFKRIVVGTDGSETATAAVRRASELAELCGARVHLVMAYRKANTALLAGMPGEAMLLGTGEEFQQAADPRPYVEESLESAAKPLRGQGLTVELHACPGNPAQALIDVAEGQDADLIVVGSKGMSGARRMLGSVPNNVAHHANCTVMIVHTA